MAKRWPRQVNGKNVSLEQINAHKTIVEVQNIFYAYRRFGHFHANIDPLGKPRTRRTELALEQFDFEEKDLNMPIRLGELARQSGPGESFDENYTLQDLLANLQASYCSTVGVEYMHIPDVEQCNWIRARVEKNVFTSSTDDNALWKPTKEEKLATLDQLIMATQFEEFLQSKFNDKRFGCDGAESMIGGINTLVECCAKLGVKDIVVGMAHRGRINVLTNVMGKPVQNIFREFLHGTLAQDNASGDVKYHLGVSCDREISNGESIHLSLVANPSHLEAVNPVVEGKVKAKQEKFHNGDRSKALSLLIHGDGSFAGQGIVAETITLSGLPKYSTGGTIHVIVNNQISFTTDPVDARADSDYCTGVAIPNGAPILHVNGDDPEAVNWAFKMAAEWRQTFHKDFVIDIVCYRRYGHNESDQPLFTQPVMYTKIASMPKTLDIYSQKLIAEGIISKQDLDARRAANGAMFEKEYLEAKKTTSFDTSQDEFYHDVGSWKGFRKDVQNLKSVRFSSISPEMFDAVGKALYTLPEGFKVHSTIEKALTAKQQMIESGQGIDWATAEALAFGSLLAEGVPVRLSGQDVERGTFSHRHAVLHDQNTFGRTYKPLNNIVLPGASTERGNFSVTNSFLSEYAALGYEYGYALENPNALVLWEAQFGDFVNGGQIIIDQFISGCEQKWQRQNGLVMLLPHGMEGAGPEHSSARLERFLQLCDQDSDSFSPLTVRQVKDCNIQVCNITVPANYFHALRRQVLREFRKPLIIMSPKSLLRHPMARSERKEFDGPELKFIRVYGETDETIASQPDAVRRLIFCSGKVYFDLVEARAKSADPKALAIVRVEQLAPFPFDDVERQVQKYKNAEIVWCQEEHKNHGAWHFVYFNFKTVFKHAGDSRNIRYVGRATAASPATGSSRQHKKELAVLLQEAVTNDYNRE